jgi:CRISPR/Cas system-associated exonuclease Cas4 (RecB family)
VSINRYYSLLDQKFKYEANGLVYPSVSAILSETRDDFFHHRIEGWKAELITEHGLKKGTNKAKSSIKIGNFVHEVLEKQLQAFPDRTHQYLRSLAKHYEPALNLVSEVVAVELPVYSTTYGYAGTIDAIVRLKDGRLAIFDHKTSLKKKTRSAIKDYFLQTAAYALAYHNMTGVKVDTVFVNIIYRQKHGVRKPTRFDSYEVKSLRREVIRFLDRLDRYRIKHLAESPQW